MKKPGWIAVFLIVACTSIFLQSIGDLRAEAATELSSVTFTLPPPDSAKTETYLGLDSMKPFKVGDIKAQMVVLELMSSWCPHCQASAPVMNQIYRRMQEDPGLADVKVLAIALADNKIGVATFKKEFKTPFPILLDADHKITHSLKGLGTPTVLVVWTKDAKVLYTHVGEIRDADGFIKEVKFVKQLQALEK